MERIAILGISLGGTDVRTLERFSRPVAERGDAIWLELADHLAASELVLLSTCNRLEVCYARESGDPPRAEDALAVVAALGLDAGDAALLTFRADREALRHLFRVAASLDSLVVGEDQIISQTRAAHARAEGLGLLGRLLASAFEHAFQVGKQVRAKTELARGSLSVVGIGVALVAERFAGRPARVAVIGAGEMGELAARALAGAGLGPALVVNRSQPAAARLAAALGAAPLDLERFRAGAEPVDALVSATAAPGVVLDRAALARLAPVTPLGEPLLAVDLAIPRDLEPAPEARVEIVDLDQLRSRALDNAHQRRLAALEAEALVERKLEALDREVAEPSVTAALSELHQESSAVFERELAQLFHGPLGELDERAQRTLERWARTAFGRVSHVPIQAIKQLARELRSGPSGKEEA
jgi:glutamyl-tRNA reductase